MVRRRLRAARAGDSDEKKWRAPAPDRAGRDGLEQAVPGWAGSPRAAGRIAGKLFPRGPVRAGRRAGKWRAVPGPTEQTLGPCRADRGDTRAEAGRLQPGPLRADEIRYFGSRRFDFAAAENV
jgi:hypothetical protein